MQTKAPYPHRHFSSLLCLHFTTASALTLHRFSSARTFRKYVKIWRKQPAEPALAALGENMFETLCFPSGCTFPSMVLSQRQQFQHNLCRYPAVAETDDKIPVYKLGAVPIFINSDITEILELPCSTRFGKKGNFKSKDNSPRNFSISREVLLLQRGTCGLSGEDITDNTFSNCCCSLSLV